MAQHDLNQKYRKASAAQQAAMRKEYNIQETAPVEQTPNDKQPQG